MNSLLDQNNGQLFFSFDGDEIGKRHAAAVLSDDTNEISDISSKITEANEMVRDFVESNGGQMISFGGDEGLFSAPADFVELLEQLRKDYEYMVGATLSIGYGSKPSEAGKALLEAKETGKNKVVQYSEGTEKYAQDVQEHRDSESGQKSGQSVQIPKDDKGDEGVGHEKVLPAGADSAQNEPTLCEPPKEDNNRGYDSGYKNSDPGQRDQAYEANKQTPPGIEKPNLRQKAPVEQAVSTDVQEASRPMNEELPDPKDQEAIDKKPAPREYHGQAEGDNMPDNQQMEKPSDLKYISGKQAEPQAGIPIENATTDVAEQTEAQDMDDEKHCPTCACGAHDEAAEGEGSADAVLDQHVENAQEMEAEMGEGQPKNTTDILDQHLDNANSMLADMDENGVSRPADYDQKSGDMGLSEEEADEDEPSLDEVLQGGLDEHAQNIQKEKVLQMVGEALDGFKAQKPILDKAKQAAPELYDSCLKMLKAMIELCSLAGLDNAEEANQEVNEIEGQGAEEVPAEEERDKVNQEAVPAFGGPKPEGQKPPQQ